MALSLAALQNIQTVKVPDAREGIMTLAAARSQMLGDQLKGLQVQQAQGELQTGQLQAQQAQQIREIVAKHNGDIESALPEINTINPSAGASMAKTFQDIKNLQSEQTVREGTLNETTRKNLADENAARAAAAETNRHNLQVEGQPKIVSPGSSVFDNLRGFVGQAPSAARVPVPGTDIPLPPAVEAQKGRIAQAGKTPAAMPDLNSAVSTTRSGMKYVDVSQFSGNDKNAITDAANKAGIPPVAKDTADLLSEIDNARENLDYMMQSIAPKLAKDASGRPKTAITNTIEQMAQSDPDLAAIGTYRSAAIQAMRAVAGAKGLRINRAEIEMAQENDIPKMTDTLPVAQAKLKNMMKFLDNAEKAHLVKDRSKLPTSGGDLKNMSTDDLFKQLGGG